MIWDIAQRALEILTLQQTGIPLNYDHPPDQHFTQYTNVDRNSWGFHLYRYGKGLSRGMAWTVHNLEDNPAPNSIVALFFFNKKLTP